MSKNSSIIIFLWTHIYCKIQIQELVFLPGTGSVNIRMVLGERERDKISLISVSLLLNKFKIDQESSIFYLGQICSLCSIKLKKLKLQGLLSFNSFITCHKI